MLEYLADLQTRNIHTKPELYLEGAFYLGERVFEILKGLINQGKIKGAYLSHYFQPPDTLPHVKVGIRYKELTDLATVNQLLNKLCAKYKDIVTDKGRFEQTTGEYQRFPHDIVVDYLACHSFKFLLKAKDELGSKLPPIDKIVKWFLQNKDEVTNSIIKTRDIFRANTNARTLKPLEIGWIWERFVHHLLNAYHCTYDPSDPVQSYEFKLKQALRENGILIY